MKQEGKAVTSLGAAAAPGPVSSCFPKLPVGQQAWAFLSPLCRCDFRTVGFAKETPFLPLPQHRFWVLVGLGSQEHLFLPVLASLTPSPDSSSTQCLCYGDRGLRPSSE